MSQNRTKITYTMLERISKIHKKLLAERYPSEKQLAQELEVSVITISRDIEYMRNRLYAPIEYDPKRRGLYYEEPYTMPTYSLSAKDMQVLAATETLLSHYRNTPLYAEACAVLELLSASVVKGSGGALQGRIALPPTPLSSIDMDSWNAVCEAMRRNVLLEFDYTGRWRAEKTHRRVRPYQLLLDGGVCYLFGYAEERGAERLFVLSRMEGIVVTDEAFTLPKDFAFASRCGGGMFGAFFGTQAERYRIAFYDDARVWVRECTWAADQQISEAEDATVIAFTATQRDKVLQWVLAQGHNAVPLEPEWLVERWKFHIRRMALGAGIALAEENADG